MTILVFSILIDEWDELNQGLHVIEGFKSQMYQGVLRIFLEVNELLKGHVSSKTLQNLFLCSLECTGCYHCDHLLHLDERLMIILSHLFNLFD